MIELGRLTKLLATAAMAVAMGTFAANDAAATPVLAAGATAGNIDLGSGTEVGSGISTGGFLFTPVNLTSGAGAGNCGDVGGTCFQLSKNATTTMTTYGPVGGAFNLEGLSFVLAGMQAELGFNAALSGNTLVISAEVGASGCGSTFCVQHNKWYNILFNGAADNVTGILFDNLGMGNVKIGGIRASAVVTPTPAAVPLPAPILLLLGGLGGFGLIARRRKAAKA